MEVATAYPGTPSTEILERLAGYPEVYAEWSVNEKVAVEVALGATAVGARALAAMKLVGVNVSSDPVFSASYSGVRGGFVLVSADDPGRHSSQNEQDNRHYARFLKVPLLEPADSQEAKDFVGEAFALSEEFHVPVILRTTTRISHSKGTVMLGDRVEAAAPLQVTRDVMYNLTPGLSAGCHPRQEARLLELAARSDATPLNRIEWGDPRIGIVASGVAYTYAREAFPSAGFLKLGMSYPVPARLARGFRAGVDLLYVVEELDGFLEDELRMLGIRVDGGKDVVPLCGELDPAIVAEALTAAGAPGAAWAGIAKSNPPVAGLSVRSPTFCPGCPHRGVFLALKHLKVYVSGDIGCYTMASIAPWDIMHSMMCMGASIGMAHGMEKALRRRGVAEGGVVAVIGDSTFFHSGMTALLDVTWNRGSSVTIILDNRAVAMTGGQPTPGSGTTLMGAQTRIADVAEVARALGVDHVVVADPFDVRGFEEVVKTALASPEPWVIVSKAPCALQYMIKSDPFEVDAEACTGCRRCLKAVCAALSFEPGVGPRGRGLAGIDPAVCTGCGVCAQLCRLGAIGVPGALQRPPGAAQPEIGM